MSILLLLATFNTGLSHKKLNLENIFYSFTYIINVQFKLGLGEHKGSANDIGRLLFPLSIPLISHKIQNYNDNRDTEIHKLIYETFID